LQEYPFTYTLFLEFQEFDYKKFLDLKEMEKMLDKTMFETLFEVLERKDDTVLRTSTKIENFDIKIECEKFFDKLEYENVYFWITFWFLRHSLTTKHSRKENEFLDLRDKIFQGEVKALEAALDTVFSFVSRNIYEVLKTQLNLVKAAIEYVKDETRKLDAVFK